MNLQYAKDPRWSNAENTSIDLIIKWDEFPRELPFTARPDDTEEHGRAIFAAAAAGAFGEVGAYAPPPPLPQPAPPAA
jgi:hypothetical protein